MVAAAKLRRAEHAAFGARPYHLALVALVQRVAARSGQESHPLLQPKEKVQRRELLIFSSDRGLCGGFNSNLLRKLGATVEQWRETGIQTDCRVIGKRGRDYFNAKELKQEECFTGLYDKIKREETEKLVQPLLDRFLNGKTDEVWITYNRFKSVLSQEVTLERILPLGDQKGTQKVQVDYLYEPNRSSVLDKLLRETVITRVHQAFLESFAAELAARMTAMDSATKNASDMIQFLTLQFNRARQAAITRELMDIVNGAEALQ